MICDCEAERCCESCLKWLNKHDEQIRREERARVLDVIFAELADVDAWGEKGESYLIKDDDVKEILHNLRQQGAEK